MHRAATDVPVRPDDESDPGPSRAREEPSIIFSLFLRPPVFPIAGTPVKRGEEELAPADGGGQGTDGGLTITAKKLGRQLRVADLLRCLTTWEKRRTC